MAFKIHLWLFSLLFFVASTKSSNYKNSIEHCSKDMSTGREVLTVFNTINSGLIPLLCPLHIQSECQNLIGTITTIVETSSETLFPINEGTGQTKYKCSALATLIYFNAKNSQEYDANPDCEVCTDFLMFVWNIMLTPTELMSKWAERFSKGTSENDCHKILTDNIGFSCIFNKIGGA